MNLIVISSPDLFNPEAATLTTLFKEGLQSFHLRKPKFDREKLERYIQLIPKRYHNRIVLHTHHSLAIKYKLKGVHLTKTHRKKRLMFLRLLLMKIRLRSLIVTRTYHRLADLKVSSKRYNYVFLSPVFGGISSENRSTYTPEAIQRTLRESSQKVIALGGVNLTTIDQINTLGFNGAALHGSMWNQNSDHVELYKSAKRILDNSALEKMADSLLD